MPTLRVIALVSAIAVAGLWAACTTAPVAVSYDRSEDFSKYRTWDWIDGAAIVVHTLDDPPKVQAQPASLIERGLRERGLEREAGAAELRVAALLVVKRTYQVFRRARAMETLHSNHDVGTYEVQGDVMDRRAVDRCRLAIYVTGPHQERLVWQAELD